MTNKKIALIIGGNSGVGKKTAQDLAQENYRIMIVARNREKGEQVVQQLQQTTRNSDISFIQADLSTKEAVTKLSRVLSENVDHLDVLVSSIGIMQPTQQLTKDGYDQNFVLNYLTHFWLINALLPLVKKADQGRILMVGALPVIVRRLKVNPPQPVPSTENYSGMQVTGDALGGRILLTQKLAHLLKDTSVTVNIFHPGNIPDSSYGTESSGLLLKIIGPLFARLSKKNPPIGAMLATDVSLTNTSGQFFNESGKVVPLPAQFSAQMADQWWTISSQL
ncbi:SDR family NAD(P)-dependent oxidoreductase [Enterococcus avium]|uniref:SDR family NAD(P)-dependent oxidoreductase n=1 Tax=Enterococcus avium TaxID=33945 RepID=UPI0023307E78|nr:SDR family NAD(P)-dependent oxidoreductase [Enterococcus avium]MDB1748332.1 SDR family NAD(P)-dependent oxidoreductase [Enterococcus avium]MDB1752536.1 SDR family NAD(P)-dependent oxidoreductase [Enterococcus avium]MDB1759726.1 SDR family NAD(P)-dependent oxidoreductase [Enterococcus avium]